MSPVNYGGRLPAASARAARAPAPSASAGRPRVPLATAYVPYQKFGETCPKKRSPKARSSPAFTGPINKEAQHERQPERTVDRPDGG